MTDSEGNKTLLSSKTVHFNTWSGLLVSAVWPFIPEHFRHQDYAMQAVTAWFSIGNILLRLVTKGAIILFGGKHVELDEKK